VVPEDKLMNRVILLGDHVDWRNNVLLANSSERFIISDLAFNSDSINRYDIDIILPFTILDYDILRKSPEATKKALMPLSKTAGLADDKVKFNSWLNRIGYGHLVPEMYHQSPARYPVIFKMRSDEWGLNSVICTNERELRAACENYSPKEYFIQFYVAGREEHVTHIISINGRILFATTFINYFDTDLYVKGVKCDATKFDIIAGFIPIELSDIIARLKYTGCSCFNYKYVNGVPMIFELNPRVGGSFTRCLSPYLISYVSAVEARAAVTENGPPLIRWFRQKCRRVR
jgi:hypothetical protein